MKKLIVMLAVLMLLGQAAYAAVTIQDTLARAVPENAIIFATIEDFQGIWGGISSSNAWKKIKALKIWREMQVGSSFDQFRTEFKQNLGFDFSKENILALMGRELALAVTGDAETMQFNLVIIARPGDPVKAKELVKTFTETINAAGEKFSFVESKSLHTVQAVELPMIAGLPFVSTGAPSATGQSR